MSYLRGLLIEYIADGFEIFHAVDFVGFQIAAFGPLVPGIDS